MDLKNGFISKENRRGVFWLLIVTLIIIYIPRVLLFFSPSNDIKIDQSKIELLNKKTSYNHSFKKQSKKPARKKYRSPKSKFNPNEYNSLDWQSLGLSKKQSDVIIAFSKRGLKSNEDLKKIYVLPNELFLLIKDSTVYPVGDIVNKKLPPQVKIKVKKVIVELNNASSNDLLKIVGIGPYFSNKIIDYRDRLGGYIHKEQLLEIWKMDAEKYLRIAPFIEINNEIIKYIKINQIEVGDLKKHPYLNWNQANSIIKIRNQKGAYKNIDEIKESVLITEECFEKLKPYLSL